MYPHHDWSKFAGCVKWIVGWVWLRLRSSKGGRCAGRDIHYHHGVVVEGVSRVAGVDCRVGVVETQIWQSRQVCREGYSLLSWHV